MFCRNPEDLQETLYGTRLILEDNLDKSRVGRGGGEERKGADVFIKPTVAPDILSLASVSSGPDNQINFDDL